MKADFVAKRFTGLTINVKVTFGREARLRLFLGAKLIQLAGFVLSGAAGHLDIDLDQYGNPKTL